MRLIWNVFDFGRVICEPNFITIKVIFFWLCMDRALSGPSLICIEIHFSLFISRSSNIESDFHLDQFISGPSHEQRSFYLGPVLSVPSFILPSVVRINVPSLFFTNFEPFDMPFGYFVCQSSVVPRLFLPGPSFLPSFILQK